MYISCTRKAVERGFLVIPSTWNPAKEKSHVGFAYGGSPPPSKANICTMNCKRARCSDGALLEGAPGLCSGALEFAVLLLIN